MKNKMNKVFSLFKKYWLLLFSVVAVVFGVGDVVEAYTLRISDNWSVAVYHLVSGLGLIGLSFDMILVHFFDDLYCKISGKEPDKNKNENKE